MAQENFERFGNYILLERLASGGMAEIHLSKKLAAEGLQKFVAVKRILSQHSASEDFIRMFKDEAKIAVNLSHSNVVSIYDFGVENNQLYLVMEYLEGKNLRQILNRLKQLNKRFSVSHIAYIIKLIAAGLDHAHRLIDATTGERLNIIHRDMSPQNVMISFEGEVKIIDFGIAKSTSQEEVTRVGTLKGKFGYMSPEQVDGLEVDARTDIFAVGIMLWEMLSEQRLFLTNNEMTTLRKIRDCKIPSLREMDPNIPIELEKIVNKSLARNKAQRYQTAAEIQKDLQSFLNRYNPDFSSQDFSEFIKEVYSEEIVEARKRQVVYSRVAIPQEPLPTAPAGSDSMTQSMTFNKTQTESFSSGNLDFLNNKTQNTNIPEANDANTSHLTLTSKIAHRLSNLQNSTQTNASSNIQIKSQPQVSDLKHNFNNIPLKQTSNETLNKSYNTNSSIRIPQNTAPTSSPILGIVIVLIAGIVGIFAVINETQPKMVASQCQSIKKMGVPINCYEIGTVANASVDTLSVLSEPPGAKIYLNNVPTPLQTPAKIPIPRGKPFKIGLSLNGYRNEMLYFKDFPINSQAYQKLTSIPSGKITVRIVGGEAYLDGVKLQNGQEIAVEANKELKFITKSPITGTTVEKRVTVKVNESKEILLSPR